MARWFGLLQRELKGKDARVLAVGSWAGTLHLVRVKRHGWA